MKSLRTVMTGVFLLLAGIGLTAVGVSKLFQRNEYKAIAFIKVIRDPHRPSDSSYDPYFILTELETIQSHAVLANVIVMLDLDEVWGNKYNRGKRLSSSKTEERIKRHLELKIIRETKLIRIGVFDNDPIEAAKLANAIARQYCEYKTARFRRLVSEWGKSAESLNYEAPEVVDPAIPPTRPIGPNRYLGGAMLGCGLFLVIVGTSSLNKAKINPSANPS